MGSSEPAITSGTDSELIVDVGDDDAPRGDSGGTQPTDLGREPRSRIDEADDPERTSDFILSPSIRIGDAEETRPENEDEVGDRDRTVTTDLTDREPEANGQSKAATGWPTIPNYNILQRLGEGGMGVVYKARHLGLNRLVALKMIRGGSQARTDHVSRFRVEAEAVAQLRY